MNDQLEQTVPLPTAPLTVEAVEADEPTSVMDHARQFGPNADKAEDEPEPLNPIRPVDQQKREQGKFAEGRRPMKAKDAVERINQLTGRAKSAEEKLQAAETELATLRQQRAPAAQVAKAEHKVEQAERKADSTFTDPEPSEDDPKFAGDYGKYLRAAAAWDIRKENHEARATAKAQESESARRTSWQGKVNDAKTRYPDFEAVAFAATQIPVGSTVDAWIDEHRAGADVLYYLQSHPQELGSVLGMPVVEQLEHLALLSQRLLPKASPQSTQAGKTGSAAGRHVVVLPPRPPNPVRTEAQRASDGPPPTDGSLSVIGHRKTFHRS